VPFTLKHIINKKRNSTVRTEWQYCTFFVQYDTSNPNNISLYFLCKGAYCILCSNYRFWPQVRLPVFLGRCALSPCPSQLRCFLFIPQKIQKNELFPETKCFPSGPNSDQKGRISFHWAKLDPTELHCILLSYAAPSWAEMHPNELHCTLLRYAVPSKLCCIQGRIFARQP